MTTSISTRYADHHAGFTGVYEPMEAALYLQADIRNRNLNYGVTSRHLLRWIRSSVADPSFQNVPGRELLITFEDLISMRVVAFLRSQHYSFRKIRRAEKYLAQITKYPRPFATAPIWAEEQGTSNIFAEIGHILAIASKGGQLAFVELVKQKLVNMHGLHFDERNVADWWAPQRNILLNPKIQFGRPCIANTRIPTADIAGMVAAGDKEDFLARSYGIQVELIQAALDWERGIATARSN